MNQENKINLSGPMRSQIGKKTTLLGTGINLFLTFFKFSAGILGNSQAMIADAVHSLSDFASDIIVILGFEFTGKPEDKNHPYGHGRAETLATFMVGIILFLVALGILRGATLSIIAEKYEKPGLYALVAAVLSVILKEFLYFYTLKKGKYINSDALKANAWHHRSDSMSSVAAFLGITASMINPEYHIFDSIAAIVVSFICIRSSVDILKEPVKNIMESSVDEKTVNFISKIAKNKNGVLNVHNLKTRKVGNSIFADMHIEVDPEITVIKAHNIAESVKKEIKNKIDNIEDVLIHIEPKNHIS